MDEISSNLEDIAPWRRNFDRKFVGGLEGLVKMVTVHWLALANLVNFLFVFFAVLAPILMSQGFTLPARIIYLLYKATCHQLPYRSYFVSGYQMAFCQRNFAIYSSMFLAGVVFTFLRDRLKPIDWRLYVALITPMAIDGFTQLFGLRESNWELRTITGTLFGVGTIWLLYPYVEIGMKDAREVVEATIGRPETKIRIDADSVGGPAGG